VTCILLGLLHLIEQRPEGWCYLTVAKLILESLCLSNGSQSQDMDLRMHTELGKILKTLSHVCHVSSSRIFCYVSVQHCAVSWSLERNVLLTLFH
jgi:hypothetical protein